MVVSVEFTFEVKDVTPSIIPSIFHVKGASNGDYNILVELSEKLGLSYKAGEKLKLRFMKGKPSEFNPEDYCGKAFLFAIKEKKEGKSKKYIYLLSVGGLIIRIEAKKKIKDFKIADEYYFCLSRE